MAMYAEPGSVEWRKQVVLMHFGEMVDAVEDPDDGVFGEVAVEFAAFGRHGARAHKRDFEFAWTSFGLFANRDRLFARWAAACIPDAALMQVLLELARFHVRQQLSFGDEIAGPPLTANRGEVDVTGDGDGDVLGEGRVSSLLGWPMEGEADHALEGAVAVLGLEQGLVGAYN